MWLDGVIEGGRGMWGREWRRGCGCSGGGCCCIAEPQDKVVRNPEPALRDIKQFCIFVLKTFSCFLIFIDFILKPFIPICFSFRSAIILSFFADGSFIS